MNWQARAEGRVRRSSRQAIEVAHLAIGYEGLRRAFGGKASCSARILSSDITFRVELGQALVILGPNGSGKTTLLRTLLGLHPPLSGEVLVDGERVLACSPQQRARLLAYVPQAYHCDFAFTVRDMVAMGRAPYLSSFAPPSESDLARADRALRRLGIAHLAEASESQLSGGEQRLVLIARALAQESRFFLLDEPTANLDVANERRVLAHVRALARAEFGVVMTSHAPGHAFACATHAALLDRRGHFEVGPVADVLTEESLARVYGVAMRIVSIPTMQGEIRTCVPDLSSV